MKIPKGIDFSNVNEKKLFKNSSKEYKTLMSLNDEGEWKDYVNEMLSVGISVTYDASGDFFIIKPVAFKENNSKMYSKGKKLKLDDFSFLFEDASSMDDSSSDYEINLNEESYPWDECISDQEKRYGSKKRAEKICGSIKAKNENKTNKGKKLVENNFDKKYLLHDDDEEELEDLNNNNLDIESSVNDLIHLDDDDVELATPETAEVAAPNQTQQPTANLTVADIENIVKQFLSGQNSTTDQPTSVPDDLASGEASTVNQDTTSDVDVLESEFSENHSKINVIENKIENGESYLDILNGEGIIGEQEPVELESIESEETFAPSYEQNNNIQGPSEFDIYEEPEEERIIKESPEDELEIIQPTEYEEGDFDFVEPEEEPEIVPNNSTVNVGGTPVKIQITGWLITIPEVTALAESVKKNKAKLRKLQSNNNKELFLYVECNNKIYKIRYEDRPKLELSRPWSIKDKKFATINEAISLVRDRKITNDREKHFKNLIAQDKDLSTRSLTNLKESNIFEDYRNEKNSINYVPGWNVKHVGALDLKKGLNEVFSNITQHNNKSKNTLFKTKDGNYFLLKGNLGEASQKGEKRHLVDLEGKKDYGVGQVIGIFENNYKGLGQIMEKIQRTSIPLLVWKRK